MVNKMPMGSSTRTAAAFPGPEEIYRGIFYLSDSIFIRDYGFANVVEAVRKVCRAKFFFICFPVRFGL